MRCRPCIAFLMEEVSCVLCEGELCPETTHSATSRPERRAPSSRDRMEIGHGGERKQRFQKASGKLMWPSCREHVSRRRATMSGWQGQNTFLPEVPHAPAGPVGAASPATPCTPSFLQPLDSAGWPFPLSSPLLAAALLPARVAPSLPWGGGLRVHTARGSLASSRQNRGLSLGFGLPAFTKPLSAQDLALQG